jgi:hypothetical protein
MGFLCLKIAEVVSSQTRRVHRLTMPAYMKDNVDSFLQFGSVWQSLVPRTLDSPSLRAGISKGRRAGGVNQLV